MTRSPRGAASCRVSTFEPRADIQVEAIRRAARVRAETSSPTTWPPESPAVGIGARPSTTCSNRPSGTR